MRKEPFTMEDIKDFVCNQQQDVGWFWGNDGNYIWKPLTEIEV